MTVPFIVKLRDCFS